MLFILGIDAATWRIIKPNLETLNNFSKLYEIGKSKELILKEKPISPSVWCGMFSGKLPEEHGHDGFVKDGNIVKREDIKVDFIWDILCRNDKKVRVLNVPFIIPPYNFNVDYRNVGFGLPTNEEEWEEELERLTGKTLEYISEEPDLLISVFTLLDRIQHFYWGDDVVLYWYKKMDKKIGEMIFKSGFINNPENKLIIISDHGFCSFGEAKVMTLPKKTENRVLKGDHHENAILITYNLEYKIRKPQDVFYAAIDLINDKDQ